MSSIFGVGSGVIAVLAIGFVVIYRHYRREDLDGITALLLGFFHLVGGVCFYLGYLQWGADGGVICSIAGPLVLFFAFTYEDDGKPLLEPWEIFLLLWIIGSSNHRDYY